MYNHEEDKTTCYSTLEQIPYRFLRLQVKFSRAVTFIAPTEKEERKLTFFEESMWLLEMLSNVLVTHLNFYVDKLPMPECSLTRGV